MSKHTRYFSTYLDAYNYYNGGVVPSTEIALVGDASYIFVSSDNTASGNTAFFDAGMTNDEIVDTMVDTAYTNGTTYGEAIGYTAGHAAGYSEGYSYGYTQGESSVPQPEGNIEITTTSQVDVASYATAQVVDANLVAANIKSGTTILGVSGSYTGLIPEGTAYLTNTSVADVATYATAQIQDANLVAGNIVSGVSILGVDGSYVGGGITPSGTTYINANTLTDVTSYAYAYCEAEVEVPFNEQYFTLEAVDVTDLEHSLSIKNWVTGVDLYYKVNDGGWNIINHNVNMIFHPNEGDKIMLKGTNNTLWVDDGEDQYCGLKFEATDVTFKAYGNIMSLLAGDNFTNATLNTSYADQFHSLFENFTGLVSAKDIVLPSNEANNAFEGMFGGCTELVDVPVICTAPSRSLPTQTYNNMFNECINLKYVVVVTSQPLASESTEGEGYDTFVLGEFGSAANGAYLVVKSSQVDNVKEAIDNNGLNITVLQYDATTDSDCYSTDAELFCLRMAAKYLPQERYDEGYTAGYSDGEAAGYTPWEPIENVSGDLSDLSELGGTEDHLDLYWTQIEANFFKSEILDGNNNMIGYKFEWDEPGIYVEEGGTQVVKTIHVVHEVMKFNGTWPDSARTADGTPVSEWFNFAHIDGDYYNSFISDFYGQVLPVLRNVTLVPAEQGSGYDYELNFDNLVYCNYHGDMAVVPDTVTENGLVMTDQFAGFNVNVQ